MGSTMQHARPSRMFVFKNNATEINSKFNLSVKQTHVIMIYISSLY